MKYARILMAVAAECWAMEPAKLAVVMDFLALQASGVKFSEAEIEARINAAKISPAAASAVARRAGDVMVLPLQGVISHRMNLMDDISGGTSTEGFARSFKAARDDDSVKAIVMDVTSPGGTVSGVDETAALIMAARGSKPIIAQVSNMSASAAYWISAAADEIVVEPSADVGSIGVYTVHDDVTEMLKLAGVTRTLVAAGKYKVESNPYAPLGDEARDAMQERVERIHTNFINAVAKGRGVSPGKVRSEYGQGRLVDAESAVQRGMADRIGTMDETLARFGARAAKPMKSRSTAMAARELQIMELRG